MASSDTTSFRKNIDLKDSDKKKKKKVNSGKVLTFDIADISIIRLREFLFPDPMIKYYTINTMNNVSYHGGCFQG